MIKEAGCRLQIYHGQGLVVHDDVIIGNNVILRHNTTIGIKINSNNDILVPQLKNNIDIGANSVIIGDVIIGNNVIVGAGSVVVKSIPDDCKVAGNPAVIINN